MEEHYQIKVRSYKIVDPIIMKPAIHNEIAFIKNEELIVAFNGNPRNRKTGEINNPSFSGQDTLRIDIIADAEIHQAFFEEYPLVSEKTLFEGNKKEFITLMGRAVDAAQFINKQNMDYIIVGEVGAAAQNSNSVAYTLIEAMKLEHPDSDSRFWTPGDDRLLLPEDWITPNRTLDEILPKLEQFSSEAVAKKTRQDPNPYESYIPLINDEAPSGKFFNPNNIPSEKPNPVQKQEQKTTQGQETSPQDNNNLSAIEYTDMNNDYLATSFPSQSSPAVNARQNTPKTRIV